MAPQHHMFKQLCPANLFFFKLTLRSVVKYNNSEHIRLKTRSSMNIKRFQSSLAKLLHEYQFIVTQYRSTKHALSYKLNLIGAYISNDIFILY